MSDANHSKNVKDWHKAGMDPAFFPKKRLIDQNNNNKKAKQ
jgi:hypothetical protein